MSTHDSYEVRRGPVRRRKPPHSNPPKRPARKEIQAQLALYGGSNTKDGERNGIPFDDQIPF